MRVGKKQAGLNRRIFVNKPWWDLLCENIRNRKMQALRLIRHLSNSDNLSIVIICQITSISEICSNISVETRKKKKKKKRVYGPSTIDNIFTLQSLAQKYLSKPGGRFYCLYIDFSKAFDRIRHK